VTATGQGRIACAFFKDRDCLGVCQFVCPRSLPGEPFLYVSGFRPVARLCTAQTMSKSRIRRIVQRIALVHVKHDCSLDKPFPELRHEGPHKCKCGFEWGGKT
jgi:hypothetical protein